MTIPSSSINELQSRFGLPGMARLECGKGGLTRLVLTAAGAEAHIYLLGAHITHYRPAGGQPALFLSDESWFKITKPIRGGIPICFPWFGVRANDPEAPPHGFARLLEWAVESIVETEDGEVVATLVLRSTERTRTHWPHDFTLRYILKVGASLDLTLALQNTEAAPLRFEQALHTYFAVGNIENIRVFGLENTDYLSKVEGLARRNQGPYPVTIRSETDRIYLHTQTTCELEDPGLRRRLIIRKTGSNTTVVWNPWIEKSTAMPDFGNEEWRRMLCIETCAVADHAITLEPGETHLMSAQITVEPI